MFWGEYVGTRDSTTAKRQKEEDQQLLLDKVICKVSEQNYETWNGQVNVSINTANVQFHPFSKSVMQRSFRNRSMYFHGDSIIYYLVFAILLINNDKATNSSLPSLLLVPPGQNGKYPKAFRNPTIQKQWHQTHINHVTVGGLDFNPNNSFAGYTMNSSNTTIYQNYFESAYSPMDINPNPNIDIIYTNLGLMHAMPFYPLRKPDFTNPLIQLEQYIDNIIEYGQQLPNTKCIIFRNLNPIPIEVRNKQWKTWQVYYDRDNYNATSLNETHPQEQLNPAIQQCLSKYNITEQQIIGNIMNDTNITGYDICTKYTLTDHGSRHMNARIRYHILQKQLDKVEKPKVFYFDMYRLLNNRSQYTSDAIHYTQLKTLELYFITNIVNNWC